MYIIHNKLSKLCIFSKTSILSTWLHKQVKKAIIVKKALLHTKKGIIWLGLHGECIIVVEVSFFCKVLFQEMGLPIVITIHNKPAQSDKNREVHSGGGRISVTNNSTLNIQRSIRIHQLRRSLELAYLKLELLRNIRETINLLQWLRLNDLFT